MEAFDFEDVHDNQPKQVSEVSVTNVAGIDWTALLWLLPKLAVAAAITLLTAWLAGAQSSFMALLSPDSILPEIRPWVWVVTATGLSAALSVQASDALGFGKTPVRAALLIVSVLAPLVLIAVEFQHVLVPAAMASENESNAGFFLSGIIVSILLALVCCLKRFRGMAFFRSSWLTLLSFASMVFSFAFQSGIAIVLFLFLLTVLGVSTWIAGKSQFG